MTPSPETDPQVATVPVRRVRGGTAQPDADRLAVEEPLEIRLQFEEGGAPRLRQIAVTMQTPGHDAELAAGFLVSEGIVRRSGEVEGTQHCPASEAQTSHNVLTVRLAPGVGFDMGRLDRNFYTTSSCGVCGKTSLEALDLAGSPALPPGLPRLDPETVHRLPETSTPRPTRRRPTLSPSDVPPAKA